MANEIKKLLSSISGKELSKEKRIELSVRLAALILKESHSQEKISEKALSKQLSDMMEDFEGRVFTTNLTDQVFRSESSTAVFSQLSYLINKFGLPKYLPFYKKWPLIILHFLGRYCFKFMMPLFLFFLKKDMSRVLVKDSEESIRRYIDDKKQSLETVNLNHLGEAILGEQEAWKRLETYLKDLKSDYVEYVSVKISTLYSQVSVIAYEDTLEVLAERFRILLRESQKHFFVDGSGAVKKKFVNLDMEEYKDLRLTVDLFKVVLEEEEFLKCRAGIVLQAYLPDSYEILDSIIHWSKKRIERGGVPVKIRLVKGANLANEKVESSLKGWPQAPFRFKSHVDAQFKRMVQLSFKPENAVAVNIGVGSHNLFDIAYAFILRAENKVDRFVNFEMLEGMADSLKRVVNQASSGVVVYSPAAEEEYFHNAIAYLIRRLDENTGPDNFLKSYFGLRESSNAWIKEEEKFIKSLGDTESIFETLPKQNRFQDRLENITYSDSQDRDLFYNESDTDFVLENNLKWAKNLVLSYQGKCFGSVPLVIGGVESVSKETHNGIDPSNGKEIYQVSLANDRHLESLEKAVVKGKEVASSLALSDILDILKRVEIALIEKRGHFVACAMADGGKLLEQADAEVSEAIDFLRYYRIERSKWSKWNKGIAIQPKGCVCVASPWNFPVAIPIGGIVSALLSKNVVIFKPSLETSLVAYEIAKLFWDNGLPKQLLHFFTCYNEPIGSRLIQSAFIDQVILTGATHTAKRFLELRPGLQLYAETGGKNAIIVSKMSDRDLAIKSVIDSSFGHSGQKCSACSLLICDKEVYHDSSFMQQLYDAAISLKVGSVWDFSTKIGPLIRPPGPVALKGLNNLEENEEWLLAPEQIGASGRLWAPSIKRGVQQGSFSHQHEFFMPLLSIMEANDLNYAIKLVNSTPYGLTSGLHSLDEREHEIWKNQVQAGNLYINRGITGAIVRRQPFGGMKDSCFGVGFKAGGPNYLLQFSKLSTKVDAQENFKAYLPDVFQGIKSVARSYLSEQDFLLWKRILLNYEKAQREIFSQEHDFSHILGQDNLFYYTSKEVAIRLQRSDSLLDFFCIIGIAQLVPSKIKVYFERMPVEMSQEWKKSLPSNLEIVVCSDEQLVSYLLEESLYLVRFFSEAPKGFLKAISKHSIVSYEQPILESGRVELSFYYQEKSLSYDYHRYGNLGARERQR
ncbi:MAG: aldehyde dehydrogenase family protein [Chlamydiales bacterium]|nr:aldehyde dehydrogenase family protein [Chlamydiales bacterium]